MQFNLKKHNLIPTSKIEEDIFTGDFIASTKFFKLINQGKIKVQQGEIKNYTPNGVELTDGSQLNADTIVFGTGWKQELAFLPSGYADILEKDGLYLYRHILHPSIPDFAFIGFASTFNNTLTANIQSLWLI